MAPKSNLSFLPCSNQVTLAAIQSFGICFFCFNFGQKIKTKIFMHRAIWKRNNSRAESSRCSRGSYV